MKQAAFMFNIFLCTLEGLGPTQSKLTQIFLQIKFRINCTSKSIVPLKIPNVCFNDTCQIS